MKVAQTKRDRIRRIFYGRSELRSGWRLLIFLIIVVALLKADNLAIRALLHGADDATFFLVREVSEFLIFLFASWTMGRIEHRSIAEYGLPWRKAFGVEFWEGVAVGLILITMLILSLRAFGVFYFGTIALHGSDVWKWAGIYAIVFVLVALREEFRARGYGLFTLAAGLGFWPAAIISSVFFGLSHYSNPGENWIGLFNAGAFGLFVCFLLRRTGNLWLPIGLHMAFDWGETYLYGVPNSGHTPPGHFLNSVLSGPQWLAGGSAGPEGSLLCTLLIVVAWLICAAWLRDIKYPR